MVRTLRYESALDCCRQLKTGLVPHALHCPSAATPAIPLFKCQTAERISENIRPRSRGAICVRAVAGIALENREGAGKAGCLAAPMVRLQTKSRRRHHRFSHSTGLPCAMVLTVSFVLSPGTGLSCPRRPQSARCALQKLSASVGAPGPHDFSVRDLDDRPTRGRVHRIPQPTFVTIAKRPSARPRDGRKGARDLPDAASAVVCGMLARRADCAWCPCTNCPSGNLRRSLAAAADVDENPWGSRGAPAPYPPRRPLQG
jgi:hypothetical protein